MKIIAAVIVVVVFALLSAFANAQTSHTVPALIAKDGCSGTLLKAIHVCARLSDNANTEAEKDVAEACFSPLIADDIIFTRGPNTLPNKAAVLGFFRNFRGPQLDNSQTVLSDHRITDASNVGGANAEGDTITLEHIAQDFWDTVVEGSPLGPLGPNTGMTRNINTCKLDANGVWQVWRADLFEVQAFESRAPAFHPAA
jgi:hypothetical protein